MCLCLSSTDRPAQRVGRIGRPRPKASAPRASSSSRVELSAELSAELKAELSAELSGVSCERTGCERTAPRGRDEAM